MNDDDPVNHPLHYRAHPSGIEAIDITEHIWRAGGKGDAIEDLKKAVWYLEREIQRRTQ